MIRMYVDVTKFIRVAQAGSQLAIQFIKVSTANLHIEAAEETAALCKRRPTESQRYISGFGFDITARGVIVVRAGNVRIERHVAGTDAQAKLGPERLVKV